MQFKLLDSLKQPLNDSQLKSVSQIWNTQKDLNQARFFLEYESQSSVGQGFYPYHNHI